MKLKYSLSLFSHMLWLTLGIFVVSSLLFLSYVCAEKKIDLQNEKRQQSLLSAEELVSLARSYVVTGNPCYRQHYQDLLDIRDSRKPVSADYIEIFFGGIGDLRLADFTERMRRAGFSAEKFAVLAGVKTAVDNLARTERAARCVYRKAFNLITAEMCRKASLMLRDAAYD